jgi:hypothetical protein
MEDEMKTFLAIYLGDPASKSTSDWNKLDAATQKAKEKAAMEAWVKWGETNASSIVENGPPLGKTKRVDNQLTGYAVVRAETHEEAAKLFLNHPHFTIFPGTGVEVMECLPMPEMPK